MRKALIIFTISVTFYACGNQEASKKDESPNAVAGSDTTGHDHEGSESTNDLSSNPDYQKGLSLIAGSDCLTCHKVDEKNIGPAYRDVANKYDPTEANISMLADKIIKGGQGVWGAIPMTPHPAVSKADAEQMIKYVLLLKK